MSKDLLVLADEYAAACVEFAKRREWLSNHAAALERKDKLMRDLITALKLDRHEVADWPADSRAAIEAITKELALPQPPETT